MRVYNKSEFVTDKFLKELESKLNIQIESLAREKYFQGIGKGLDSKILDTFEQLKRGESEEIMNPEQALEQAMETFREKKLAATQRLGSYVEQNKELFRMKHNTERMDIVKNITKNWGNEDFKSVETSENDSMRQEIVDKKGISLSGISPAKYTKEHIAAAIYYFINFHLPVIKRQDIIDTKILEKNEDFEEVIKGLTIAFENNYENFEVGHIKPDFLKEETDLEHNFKYQDKKKLKHLNKIKEIEERKRYLRCSCTPEEALELVAEDMREKQEEKRNVIREGYVIRDDAMEVDEYYKNDYRNKYLQVAEHGLVAKTNLGPLLNQEVEEVMVKYQDQVVFNDKISFF